MVDICCNFFEADYIFVLGVDDSFAWEEEEEEEGSDSFYEELEVESKQKEKERLDKTSLPRAFHHPEVSP